MGKREDDIKAYIRTNFPNDANKIRASMNYRQLSRLVQDLSGGVPKVLGQIPDEVRDERIFGSIATGETPAATATTTETTTTTTGSGSSGLTIGTVQTGASGTPAAASITNNQLNLTLPRGAAGNDGSAGNDGANATIAVGTVSTGAAGSSATVSNSGSATNAVLDFSIPQGAQGIQGNAGTNGSDGSDGTAATIAVGTVSTVSAGGSATVSNAGTSSAAVFNFGIPRGADGSNGSNGSDGSAATIAVGTVSTLSAGASATVSNAGTSSAAVLNFGIPQGAQGNAGTNGTNGTKGTNGADGAAATIAVGTVSTLAAGQPATVSNSGTSSAAVFDFGIPQGASGGGGGGGTFTGSIAANQIAVGSGTDAIGGSSKLTFVSPNQFTLTTGGADIPTINLSANSHAVSLMNREAHALHISDGVDDGSGLGGELTLATRATANYASSMTPLAGSLRLNADQTGTNSPLLRINTASGYLRLGPQNSSFCHFYTDRTYFYFNKPIQFDGGALFAYNDDLQIKTDDTGSGQPTRIYIDAQVDECRVGIGNGFENNVPTTLPQKELHVNGDVRISSQNMTSGGTSGGAVFITPTGDLVAQPLGAPLNIPTDGVAIDISSPANQFMTMISDSGNPYTLLIGANMPALGTEIIIQMGARNDLPNHTIDFNTVAGARVIFGTQILSLTNPAGTAMSVRPQTTAYTLITQKSDSVSQARDYVSAPYLKLRYLGVQTIFEADEVAGTPPALTAKPTFLIMHMPYYLERGETAAAVQFN